MPMGRWCAADEYVAPASRRLAGDASVPADVTDRRPVSRRGTEAVGLDDRAGNIRR